MPQQRVKRDADYIFYELTRSVCPSCLTTIDPQILIKDGRVIMRKRCPEHGWFEALISSDAEIYLNSLRYNKPGTMPLDFSTEVVDGCPRDCGLCPEHKQHTCLALIEVNTYCNLDCPICFADAQPGFSLSTAQVERMLDRFIELEGDPEVVQFSGGEPTIHPEILPMVRMASDKGNKVVMLNTNGTRIYRDSHRWPGHSQHRRSTKRRILFPLASGFSRVGNSVSCGNWVGRCRKKTGRSRHIHRVRHSVPRTCCNLLRQTVNFQPPF